MTTESTIRRSRVLVVDDETPNRTLADCVLSGAGYDVVSASDGPEALRIVGQQPPFDVFVIDLLMPQMRGDELARRLRAMNPDSKILYFTGYSDQLFDERKVLWANEAFIEKPVSRDGLLEAVSLLLNISV